MLVFSRTRGESLIIGGGQVKVTIIDVRGDKVRVGVEAPMSIRVDREEVAIKRAQAADTK